MAAIARWPNESVFTPMSPLRRKRSGLSLVELLVAVSILGLVAAALGTLTTAVHTSNEYAIGQGGAVQHARVAMHRIRSACENATANADYPGFWVLTTQKSTWKFPDILVVWRPSGLAVDPNGAPRYSELVIFAADPNDPTHLVEVTAPDDHRVVPTLSSTSSWATNINAILSADTSKKIMLTDRLRVASHGTASTDERAAIRFEMRYRPTLAEWSAFKAGTKPWADLSWPQNLYGSTAGVRQSWCAIELQVMPLGFECRGTDAAALALTFFDSAALYYQLER